MQVLFSKKIPNNDIQPPMLHTTDQNGTIRFDLKKYRETGKSQSDSKHSELFMLNPTPAPKNKSCSDDDRVHRRARGRSRSRTRS